MRIYCKAATLKALRKYQEYELVGPDWRRQRITQEQAAELVRAARIIQAPGPLLDCLGFLLHLRSPNGKECWLARIESTCPYSDEKK